MMVPGRLGYTGESLCVSLSPPIIVIIGPLTGELGGSSMIINREVDKSTTAVLLGNSVKSELSGVDMTVVVYTLISDSGYSFHLSEWVFFAPTSDSGYFFHLSEWVFFSPTNAEYT